MSKKRPALKNAPDGSTRRDVFQYANSLLLPALFGGAQAAMATGPLKPGRDIYRSIGVEPVINCRGTFTIIGASVELPEVRAAMEAAAQQFVQLDELAEGVGRRLAELTGAEWGMVSAGCAAGLKHVTAACVAGGNPEKLLRIPDLAGLDKTEVVAPRSARSVYDHAVRNIGVKMITVDTIEELEAALSPRTAMIYLSAGGSGPFALENVARLAKPRGIPILVDAAAEVLTIPNVHLQRGATVVAYSGGKAICGPQCAGLLLGRKDILMSAWQASSPHHGPGRDNKVGREETLGMLAAVEAWVKRDHEAEWKKWLSYLDTISTRLAKIEGIQTAVHEPNGLSNKSPSLSISWDPAKLHVTGEEIAEEVARTKPRIALGAGSMRRRRGAEPESEGNKTSINITAWMMQPGDDKVVADRLFEVLSRNRAPKPEPQAPSANLSGRWDVEVTYFSSKSHHTLTLEQNGNHLQGSHQGDFSVRDVYGTIEGDQIKLQSTDAKPGDVIPFTFAGTFAGGGFSGPVYMGEYLNAKFIAKRRPFPERRGKIMIPGGPPLAN